MSMGHMQNPRPPDHSLKRTGDSGRRIRPQPQQKSGVVPPPPLSASVRQKMRQASGRHLVWGTGYFVCGVA